VVFHAGTKKDGGRGVSSGGRVLGVTPLGSGISQAIAAAYKAVSGTVFDGVQVRKDIGLKALNRR
ncbi:MAG: phosphoribosylamine--glycine ligase, partial [Candidatus Omnitrophica bacterium]|nr:phosphoribosylamine--glycine ligase [Candidatus Omnitrophota bacterium]